MPDDTVYADSSGNLDDAQATKITTTTDSYTNTRNATDSNSAPATTGTVSYCGYGRNTNSAFKYVYRVFFNFDLSGLDSSDTVSEATLKFSSNADLSNMFSTMTADTGEHVHVCKAAFGASWDTGDFNGMVGWVSSGDYDGEVTEYTSPASQAASTQYELTLNSTAITDINNAMGLSSIQMAILTSQDFNDGVWDDPYVQGFVGARGIRVNMMEYVTESSRPHIELTYESAALDNAILFGTNF